MDKWNQGATDQQTYIKFDNMDELTDHRHSFFNHYDPDRDEQKIQNEFYM